MQVLVLQNIDLPIAGIHYSIFIFPLFIILLPFELESYICLLIGFFLGIMTDFFYDSPGVFASAGVFAAFIRPLILSLNEPKTGYGRDISPVINSMGIVWFLRFAIPLSAGFMLFYYCMEVFQISKLGVILLKTIISLPISIIFIFIYVLIFNPRL
ncbi:MAG: hypothetical protein KJP00_07165 [Bacteroidia bacterium]|nr:hypothetical protein [Bacteroidia bacterium]